jgi:predicted O-methyltransferase YrrM
MLRSNEVLEQIYSTGKVTSDTGESLLENSGIVREYAVALYETVRAERPTTVLEIGMAHGLSSLAILTALRDNGGEGRLISIDPNQSSTFRSIGRRNVREAGLSDRHELIEAPDFFALPELLKSGLKVDMAYIDGWHTFDYVLLDFWYTDRLLRPNGVVAFNDCGYRAIHKVIKFVLNHRKYSEMDVGLPADYFSNKLIGRLIRRVTKRNNADRYFRKLAEWEPNYDFFAEF